MGCEGWAYDDVLPYFRKAEDNDTWDNAFHGKGGPLGVSQPARPPADLRGLFRGRGGPWYPRATWTSTVKHRTVSPTTS